MAVDRKLVDDFLTFLVAEAAEEAWINNQVTIARWLRGDMEESVSWPVDARK